MEIRARKENMKSDGLYVKPKENYLQNAGKLVEDLFKKHRAVKERLHKLKEEAEIKTELACPFQPSHKKIEKYVIGGDVVKRN